MTQSGHCPSSQSPLPVCSFDTVPCLVSSLGHGNEAARIHDTSWRVSTWLATRGACAAGAKPGPYRLPTHWFHRPTITLTNVPIPRSTLRFKTTGFSEAPLPLLPTDSMSAEIVFCLALATKMAITAIFVTVATIVAERLGAMVGALVATLPVSAGPVYVFLALDHDPTFISSSALARLTLNAATAIYVTVYVLIAQRRSMWLSVSLAFAMWLTAVLVLSPVRWNVWSAFILNFFVFSVCVFIVQPFCLIRMPPTTRPWYDFVIRASLAASLVGAVVTLSFRIGPTGSGV